MDGKRVLAILLVLFCTGVLPAQERSLLAPVYPGSVPFGMGDPGEFLSKDSFENVRSFYVRQKGNPTHEESLPGGGRRAFFRYLPLSYHYDTPDDGVHVTEKAATGGTSLSRGVGAALESLNRLMHQGFLDKAELERIEKTYKPLTSWYFPMSEQLDDRGRRLQTDMVIFRRYDKEFGQTSAGDDMETIAKKMQELMEQGKQAEAIALARVMGEQQKQQAPARIQRSQSREAVEVWKKCLEEIAGSAYPVRIRIGLTPPR